MAKKSNRQGVGGRLIRWLVGILLLPFCIALAWTVVDQIAASGPVLQFWIPFLCGALCWGVIFFSLPKPMWIYVVGHELTHALWSMCFGGRIKNFKATRRGGHVVVTKSNSLVVLAPYFFPLYAVLWTLLFLLLRIWLNNGSLRFAFHFGLGVAYAFHLSLTAQVLRNDQPDLRSEGWFFSIIVIWLTHGLLLLIAIPLLTDRIGFLTSVSWLFERTARVFDAAARW